MVLFPHAKINIGLHILAKRPDGFHELELCFFAIPWTDILEITRSEQFLFTTSGLHIAGDAADNLCFKAFQLLKNDFDISPVHIHLHKIIPMGAGLGGGSSDAAFTLIGLRDLFELPLTNDELNPYANKLGSDCAFFLTDKAQFGQGKGDQLNPINTSLQGKFLLLIYPNFGISTQQAYAGVRPKPSSIYLPRQISEPISTWKSMIHNDFEESIFPTFPALANLKSQLYHLGAEYASMSGSGSTVFGIFDKEVDPLGAWADYTIWQGFIS